MSDRLFLPARGGAPGVPDIGALGRSERIDERHEVPFGERDASPALEAEGEASVVEMISREGKG